MSGHIPFNRPSMTGREMDYILDAIQRGHIAAGGHYTSRCERLLEESLGVKKALITPSCTHALEMAALLLDLKPGDEFICPSFTFVSTANAFVLRGAKPQFVDIRPDTLNLDETKIEAAITERTRAIVPVHYAGVGCEMDRIRDIADRHGLQVVEDNAQGLYGTYRERPLGGFGELATVSFHETKNFTCGEGGVLLVNDPRYIERAEIIREKGTNRNRFRRGQVDKYTWVDIGSSYLLSDLCAAFLLAQLENRQTIQETRRALWEQYAKGLADWAGANEVGLPQCPEHCQHTSHLFYLLMPSIDSRQALIDHLKAHEIMAVFHYIPLHDSDMGLRYGYHHGDLPVTEDISDRLLRLPLYNGMTAEEQNRVMAAVRGFVV